MTISSRPPSLQYRSPIHKNSSHRQESATRLCEASDGFINRCMRNRVRSVTIDTGHGFRRQKGSAMSTVPGVLAAPAEVVTAIDQREIESIRRILFFDGVCGLCNWSVDFVLKRDRRAEFQFAPLQGDTARALLKSADSNDLNTVVLLVGVRTYRKSAAVVRVLWRLSVFWQIVGTALWLIPLPLRDLGYSLTARYRYRLFGKKDACRIPTAEERARFLP